jgi:hypothetical protein
MASIFHHLFQRHLPDTANNHWDRGRFCSTCAVCGIVLEKPPGGTWKPAGSKRAA